MHRQQWAKAQGLLFGFFIGVYSFAAFASGKPVPDYPSPTIDTSSAKNADTPFFPQNLWLLQAGGLSRVNADSGQLLQYRAARNADALAVQPSDGTLWFADNNGIDSLDLDDEPLLDAPIPLPADERVQDLAIDDRNGLLWAITESGLHRISITGQYLDFIPLDKAASPVVMRDSGELWLLADGDVVRFDVTGRLLGELAFTSLHAPLLLVGAQDGRGAWVADRTHVVGVSANGQVAFGAWRHGLKEPHFLDGDGQGGIWIADRQEVAHLDAEGRVTLRVRPVKDGLLSQPGGGSIRMIAADRRDGSLWFAMNHSAHKLNSSGALVESESLEKRGGAINAGLLHIDDAAPEIWINRPQPEIYTNDNTPPLSVAYSDFGSRVVIGSLGFTLNSVAVAVSCEADTTAADCVPTQPFEDGYHTLGATVEDLAGNASEPDDVRFTVDTIPPTITVRSPQKDLYTNQPLLGIEGDIDEFAYLRLNDEALPIDASFAFVTQKLLTEGDNVFHFHAEDRATNTSELTRTTVLDTEPPVLVVDTPEDNLVTADNTVIVSGSVNEAAVVTVAGTQATVNADRKFSLEVNLTEGMNSIVVAAQDLAGNRVSTVLTVERDVTPPSVPDVSLISVSEPDDEGYITISGLPGAAEPGGDVEIVIYENSEGMIAFSIVDPITPPPNPGLPRTLRVTVMADGSFTVRIAVPLDYEGSTAVSFTLIDAAGNRGETIETNTRDMVDQRGKLVGAIRGEFSVDPTGAANFRVPIPVPQGAANLQPELALLYSSRAGNGHLGVGWSLAGLSAITRCPKTIAQDGRSHGVTFDQTDRFCLDGQRLLPETDDAYDPGGTRYYTEIASFQRITAYGGSASTGPQWFKVEDKAGLYRYYGAPSNMPDGRIELKDSNVAQLWGISRIEDRNLGAGGTGNRIDFDYAVSTGEYRPARIHWHNNVGTKLGEVAFGYEDRRDTAKRFVPGGYPSWLTYRMNRLSVSTRPMENEPADVGVYKLSYRESPATRRSRLDAIEYCTGSGECLPKTLFNYTGEGVVFSDEIKTGVTEQFARFVDLNKDGNPDTVFRKNGSIHFRIGNQARDTFIPIDVDVQGLIGFVDADGDGYPDLVVPVSVNSFDVRWKIYRWDAFQRRFESTPYSSLLTQTRKSAGPPIPIDIDADGRQELLLKQYLPSIGRSVLMVESTDGDAPYFTGYGVGTGQNVHVIEHDGDGWSELFIESGSCSDPNDGPDIGIDPPMRDEEPDDPRTVRVTGCSVSAGLLRNLDGRLVHVTAGDPMEGPLLPPPDDGGDDGGDSGGDDGGSDDDGNPTLPPDDGGYCDPDTGICFDPQFVPLSSDSNQYDDGWSARDLFPMDANNDGLTDFVHYAGDGEWQLIINNGNGWHRFGTISDSTLATDKPERTQVADVNGDGYLDVIFFSPRTDIHGTDGMLVLRNTVDELNADGLAVLGKLSYSKDGFVLQDFNTDGKVDLLLKRDTWVVKYGQGGAPDLLNSHTDGYGEQTRVRYGAMGTHRVFDDAVYLGHLGNGEVNAAEAKQQDFMAPLYVVAAFSVDTGTDSDVLTRYQYRGARMDVEGRGFTGFREILSYNENTGIHTTNVHRQDFPFTGMVADSKQEIPGQELKPVLRGSIDDVFEGECVSKPWNCEGEVLPLSQPAGDPRLMAAASTSTAKLISRTSTTFRSIDYTALSQFKARGIYPAPDVSVTDTYDFNAGQLVTRETVKYEEYGDFGNVKAMRVKTAGANGADPYEIATHNDYSDDVSNWCLGRLTDTHVTHQFDGRTETRNSRFGYASGENCRLVSEAIEPESTNPYESLMTVYGHDSFGNVETKTVRGHNGEEIASRTTTTRYDTTGRFVVEIMNAIGHLETIGWDARFGVKTDTTGPNGLTTRWEHDGLGRAVKTVSASGQVSSVNRAWCGKSGCEAADAVYRVIESNPDNTVTYSFFDRLRRDVGGWTTTIGGKQLAVDKVYDLRGRVIAKSSPMERTSAKRCWMYIEYDNLNREIARYAPSNESACGSRAGGLPTLGAVQAVYASPPQDYHVERTVYDGLTTYTQAANGRVQSRTNYPNGWVREVAERDGRSPVSAGNRPSKMTSDGVTIRTQYFYDAQGNTRAVVDPVGNRVELNYDRMGRKTSMDDPDMGVWSYTHNAFGELIAQTDAKGQTISMGYDALGRMVRRVEPEGETAWAYDNAPGLGVGKLASVIGPNGYFEAYAYEDQLGNRSRAAVLQDGQAWWAEWEHDALGRVTRVRYPSLEAESILDNSLPDVMNGSVGAFSVRYRYDRGALTEVVDDSGSSLWKVGNSDAGGRVNHVLLGNSLQERYEYDLARGTLERNRVLENGDERLDLAYDWDAVGNLTGREDHLLGVEETFLYDALDRLGTTSTHVKDTDVIDGPVSVKHHYDALGNLKARGSAIADYQYGDTAQRKPHAVHKATINDIVEDYAYDANGNAEIAAGRSIIWTSFNKPSRISTDDGAYSEFAYGPDRARYRHTAFDGERTITTRYIGGLYERVETDGEMQHRFNIRAGGQVIAVRELTTTADNTLLKQALNYLHRDHLGSVRMISGALDTTSGEVEIIERPDFDAWGNRRNLELLKSGNEFGETLLGAQYKPAWEQFHRGFTGHEMLDHLNLVHMNGRVYDPVIGRFLSADPFVQFPESTQGYNRYTYVGNNPLSYSDPSGYFSLKKNFGIIGAIVGGAICAGTAGAGCAVAAGMISGAVGGYMATGTLSGAMTGAALGMASASYAYAIGQSFASLGPGELGGVTAQFITKATVHGITQGSLSMVGGGRFGDGFLGAFASSLSAPLVDRIPGDAFGDRALRITVAAAIGGTVTDIAGGNFANGAVTAAFVRAFNEEPSHGLRETAEKINARATRGNNRERETKFYVDKDGKIIGKTQRGCYGDDRCIFERSEIPEDAVLTGHTHVQGDRTQSRMLRGASAETANLSRLIPGPGDAAAIRLGKPHVVIMADDSVYLVGDMNVDQASLTYIKGGNPDFGRYVEQNWRPNMSNDQILEMAKSWHSND